jgi:hypothetical protein
MKQEAETENSWKAFSPAAQWLPVYQLRWLRSDAVAGITLAAYAIPVSLAYAGLAGLPPPVGIYGYLLGGLGYALVRFVTPACGGTDLGISDLSRLTVPFCSEIRTASPSTCNMGVRGEWQNRTAGLQSRGVSQLAAEPDPS